MTAARNDAFGDIFVGRSPDELNLPRAVGFLRVATRRKNCTVLEVRRRNGAGGIRETVIIQLENDGVPTRNKIGIKYREEIAFTFEAGDNRIPEVFALREDFPVTPHQNHSPFVKFRSLCIYFEPWGSLRRRWTPERHIDRVIWWLTETAQGTLHRSDQPLERLYFESSTELVLPHDFAALLERPQSRLILERRDQSGSGKEMLQGRIATPPYPASHAHTFDCLVVSISPVVHGEMEGLPHTLGALEDRLVSRGSSMRTLLGVAIKERAKGAGLGRGGEIRTLVIVRLPLLRKAGGDVERIDDIGFVVHQDLALLGVALGVLYENDGRYWSVALLDGVADDKVDWRALRLSPLELTADFTPVLARKVAGIDGEGPRGVLAGVGSLGSELLDLWVRSGWGTWTTIDPDQVKPHNLARHRAFELHVGRAKVDAVKHLADMIYRDQPARIAAIADSATNYANDQIRDGLHGAEIVIDTTTILDFPRLVAADDSIGRALTVFLTPSGRGAVMLLEDGERRVRLDCLEAQYYRHVLSNSWGDDHLAGNSGHLWTGAGCRDLSAIIPNDVIALHAGNLSGLVRRNTASPDGKIVVLRYDPTSGSVAADQFSPAAALAVSVGDSDKSTIVWDHEVRERVRSLRASRLPTETGGVLLGYWDLEARKVYIVDALPAPNDSLEERDGFVRGKAGLEETVITAQRRTGNVVGYVGEWHSHPRSYSTNASIDDCILLAHLARSLAEEGQPALMLIVGDEDENWIVGEMRENHDGR